MSAAAKLKQITDDELEGDVKWVAQQVAMLCARIAGTLRRSRDFSPDGHRPSTGGAPGSGMGGVSDPTYAAALAPNRASDKEGEETPDSWTRYDPTYVYEAKLTAAWREFITALRHLVAVVTLIDSHGDNPESDGKVRRPKLGSGYCQACGHNATGEGNDRLKGGLCDRDRMRFSRTPERWGHDKSRFIAWVKAGRPAPDTVPTGNTP